MEALTRNPDSGPDKRPLRLGSLVVIAVLLGIAGAAAARTWNAAPTTEFAASDLLGSPLPDAQVTTLAGASTTLSDLRANRPALFIVARTQDCLSCANYAFEIRLLRRRVPNLGIFLIGSGPGDSTFRAYFRDERIVAHGVLDPDRQMLRALGAQREPLTILVDSTGAVIFVDARSTGRAAQFPIGRLLPSLVANLTPMAP